MSEGTCPTSSSKELCPLLSDYIPGDGSGPVARLMVPDCINGVCKCLSSPGGRIHLPFSYVAPVTQQEELSPSFETVKL